VENVGFLVFLRLLIWQITLDGVVMNPTCNFPCLHVSFSSLTLEFFFVISQVSHGCEHSYVVVGIGAVTVESKVVKVAGLKLHAISLQVIIDGGKYNLLKEF